MCVSSCVYITRDAWRSLCARVRDRCRRFDHRKSGKGANQPVTAMAPRGSWFHCLTVTVCSAVNVCARRSDMWQKMQEIPIQNRSEFMGKQGQQVPVSSSVSQGQQIPMGSSQVPVGSSTMSQQPGMMQQQGLGQQGLGQKTFGQQGMVDRFDHEKYDKYGKERHHRHRGPVDLFGTREQGFEQQEEGTYLPRVDIHELANTIQVDVELAGVPREKIHVSADR